jgi:hypothetical protein
VGRRRDLVRLAPEHLPAHVAALRAGLVGRQHPRRGAVLAERFVKPAAFGGSDGLRHRIDLTPPQR